MTRLPRDRPLKQRGHSSERPAPTGQAPAAPAESNAHATTPGLRATPTEPSAPLNLLVLLVGHFLQIHFPGPWGPLPVGTTCGTHRVAGAVPHRPSAARCGMLHRSNQDV